MNTRRLTDSRWGAIALIAGVTLLRIVYLVRFCPYDLVEDEAHYWLWSRRLAFSYYSKGPGIAWLIAASTRLLGDTEAAVRIPAAIAAAVAAWATSAMAWRISRDRRVEFAAAALFLLAPMLQGVALVGTIDAPFVACWTIAALLCQQTLEGDRTHSWLLLGIVIAIGTLFKQTMLLAIVAIVIAALLSRRRIGGRVFLALGAFGAIVAPMFLADRASGWPALRHLVGHLHMSGGDTPVEAWHYDPLWTLTLLVLPLAIAGPAIILGIIEMFRPSVESEETVLKVFATVPFAFYAAVTLLTKPQGNWLFPACVTLLPFAARAAIARSSVHTRRIVIAAIAIGLVTGVGMLRLDLVAKIPGIGSLVPVERLFEARAVAASVEAIRPALQSERAEPVIMTSHYGIASQLAFYLPEHPTVYCASRFVGGRATQFDLWPDTDLARAGRLRGADAILVTDPKSDWSALFDRVESRAPSGTRFFTAVGRGFRPPR